MATISEFEQVRSSQYIPSEQPQESQDIVKKVNELLSRAKRYRKKFDQDWHYNYEFVISGKQWPVERPRWRFNEAVNMLWASIMTEIAIQTDARPKVEFQAQEFGDEAFVDVLKDLNDRNWERYNWSQIVADGLFDCKIYHVAHGIVEWNPDADSGLGDIDFRMLDPYYCWWDPRAQDVNSGRRARYFIYAEPAPTADLQKKYPDKKDLIKPDITNLTTKTDQGASTGRIYTNFDPYSPTRLPQASSQSGEQYGGEPQTMFIRCWMRDESLEELTVEGSELDVTTGQPKPEYALKKVYPTGRYIEMANNVLLRDDVPGVEVQGEWVPYQFDKFPIARLVNYSYAREYAGENEVTHSRGPQKIVNYVWSYILDSFRMAANPKIVVSTDSNIDTEKLTNEPGIIIETANMAGYRQEPGQAIAAGSFDLLSTATSFLDKIQGLQDVSKGADQGGATSGVMLEGYIEAAQTRPRMKNRNLDFFLQEVGQLMAELYLQFYRQPRVMRITNKDGFPEMVEFYMPDEEIVDVNGQKKTVKVAKIRRMSTIDGQIVETQNASIEVKGCPDVRIVSGSALPFAKAQKASTALQYFSAGAIDSEELLKAVDWPNYEEVLRRKAQSDAAAAQAQMQAKAGK